ncbi:MAG: hypothetical protein Greene101449_774 [Candidatus Peregrinibacteria bacterium Greene1014_49]|nr:MAG: hypothetical protein Greene101449_774 [Candidatus Peregrinibacteria bacterium Greene1014_49]
MQKLLWAFIGLMFTSAVVAEDWRALPPAFQTEFRRLLPDVGFDLAKDKVTLRNRGGVLSVQETEDFSLSFTWRQKGGKDGDVLTVAYATDGNRSGSDRSFEVRKAIAIAFQAHAGEITIHRRDESQEKKEDRNIGLGGVPFKFERDKDYAVKITSSGRSIHIEIDGKTVLKGQVPLDFEPKKGHILVYNREPYAGMVQETTLSSLELLLP